MSRILKPITQALSSESLGHLRVPPSRADARSVSGSAVIVCRGLTTALPLGSCHPPRFGPSEIILGWVVSINLKQVPASHHKEMLDSPGAAGAPCTRPAGVWHRCQSGRQCRRAGPGREGRVKAGRAEPAARAERQPRANGKDALPVSL